MNILDEMLAAPASSSDYYEDEVQFIIDSDMRVISYSTRGSVIGVVGDKNVNRVNFKMDRFYNGFDMSEFSIKVNYLNANGEPNYFVVTDTKIEDNQIKFTWLVDSDVTAYVGDVTFSVKFFKTQNDDSISNAFNTTITKLKVLEGIDVDSYIDPEAANDILSKLQSDMNEYCDTKKNEILDSIPEDYQALTNDIRNLKYDLGDNYKYISVSSNDEYIHTTMAENVPAGTIVEIKVIDCDSDVSFDGLYSDDNTFLADFEDGKVFYVVNDNYPSIKCVATNETSDVVNYKYIYREIHENSIYGNVFNLNTEVANNNANIRELYIKSDEKIDKPIMNLIDYSARTIGKSIGAYGEEVDNAEYFDASPFIRLKENTTYFGYGFYSENFFSFYDLNKEKVTEGYTVVKTSSDYNCTITVGDKPLYFRCSIRNIITDPYISQYVDFYIPYGEIDFSVLSKKNTDDIEKLMQLNKSSLYDKKILIIGDSISTDKYGNYKKWVTDLCEDGIFDANNVTNNSYHATGFVATYMEDGVVDKDTFLNRVKTIENKDTYDMVIVFGGINDFIDPRQDINWEDFTSAVDIFFEYLIQNFTQARICVLRPLRTYNIYPNKHTGKYQQEYSEYINTVAKNYCLPVLNLTDESGFCPFIDSFSNRWTLIPSGYDVTDGVHPNEQYQKKYLAPMIANFLKGLI